MWLPRFFISCQTGRTRRTRRTKIASKLEGYGELAVTKEVVGTAVIRCDAILTDGLTVLLGGITLVAQPVVLGVFGCQSIHIVITKSFGEDARCRYRQVFAIALDNGGVRQMLIGLEAVAINNDGLGTNSKLVEGTVHGKNRGIENVNLVDFLGCDHPYRPCHGIAHDDLTQGIALPLRELLGVIELFVGIVGWKDDSRRIDAASKATASCLVAARLSETDMIVGTQFMVHSA